MKYTSLKRSVAPPVEPITLAEAKAHLRIDTSDDDDLLTGYIVAAREWVEDYTSRALVEQTWTMKLADWPVEKDARGNCRRCIVLPKPPYTSVTSVQYVDTSGVTQTLAADQYVVHDDYHGAMMVEAYGVSWPSTQTREDAITVVYKAGYPKSADPLDYRVNIPQAIKTGIKRLVQGWFDDLKAEDLEANERMVSLLLSTYRVSLL